MKKYLIIFVLLIAGSGTISAQTIERGKIDSLEKQLAQLKDSTKIDCLNLIAQTISTAGSADHIYYITPMDSKG